MTKRARSSSPPLKVWILFHRDLGSGAPEVFEALRFRETAERIGVDLEIFQPNGFDLICAPSPAWNVHYRGRELDKPDFVICRTGSETDYFTLAIMRHFERRGVGLVNGSGAIEAVADKLHTMQLLVRAGLPTPATILSKFPIDIELVERELGFPVVVKSLRGTRGVGVMKSEDRASFADLVGLLENRDASDLIFQRYIAASHGRDVRVLVIGGKTVAAMERRATDGGFKSNISLGGSAEQIEPTREMRELAERAAKMLNLDIAGIDLLYDESGYRICEANSAPGFEGLERCSGLDVPEMIFDYLATRRFHAKRHNWLRRLAGMASDPTRPDPR